MFKGKPFDRFLKLSSFLFMLLTLFSIGVAIYEKYMGHAETIELRSAFVFMFFTFLAKYNYAIQYWMQRLEDINHAERKRQLDLDQE